MIVALIGCKKNDIPENGGHLYGCEMKPGWDEQFSSFVCQILGENILQFKDFKELNEFTDKVDAIFKMHTVPSVDIFYSKECESLYKKYRRHNVSNFAQNWFVTLAQLQLMAHEEIKKGYQESLTSGDYQTLRYSYFFLYNNKDHNDKKPYIAMKKFEICLCC